MPSASQSYIAREGWIPLAAVFGSAVVLYAFFGLSASLPAWLLFGLLLFLFRDPTIQPPSLPLALVSAVNGTVTRVADRHDGWLDRSAVVVVTRMSVFDVHGIYCPTEGKVMGYWPTGMQAGSAVGVESKAAAFWIRTDEGDDIIVAIARGFLGGPISFSYHTGERVGHGRRIGFAMLGGIVSIYAAANTRVEVVVGQRVVGADTVVGTLTHDQVVTAIPLEGPGSAPPAT